MYKQDQAKYSVVVNRRRAIPSIKDGLKPVQRRVVYGAYKDGLIKLSNSIKFNKVNTSTHSSKYNANGETTVLSVLKINENDAFLNQNEYIYDKIAMFEK